MRNEPFTIYVHRDYRARLFPWWGTMAHGLGKVGWGGSGVWRSRSRDGLVRKMERWAQKEHRRCGNPDDAVVEVVNDYR